VTVAILEGMTIKNQNTNEVFTLVKSSKDDILYGVNNTKIIKMDDENEDDYIVENLDCLEKVENFLEIDRGEKNPLIIRENDYTFFKIKKAIEFESFDSNEYTDISIKVVEMTVEEYYKKTKYYQHYFKLRDTVHELYKTIL